MRYSRYPIEYLQMDNSASATHRLSLQRSQVNCVKELSLCCLQSCPSSVRVPPVCVCVLVSMCVCAAFVAARILQLQRVEVAPR